MRRELTSQGLMYIFVSLFIFLVVPFLKLLI